MRLPTYGGLFPWEFEKDGRDIRELVGRYLVQHGCRSAPAIARPACAICFSAARPTSPCSTS